MNQKSRGRTSSEQITRDINRKSRRAGVIARRKRIKKRTITKRRLHYQRYATLTKNEKQNSPLGTRYVCSICLTTDNVSTNRVPSFGLL